MKELTVKEFSRYCNISEHTVRYYTKIGLLPTIIGENGYHYYEEIAMDVLTQIEVLKRANLKLSEIKNLLKTDDNELLMVSLKQAKINLEKEKLKIDEQINNIDELLKRTNCVSTSVKKIKINRNYLILGKFYQERLLTIKEEYQLIKNYNPPLNYNDVSYLYDYEEKALSLLTNSDEGDYSIAGEYLVVESYISFDFDPEDLKAMIYQQIEKVGLKAPNKFKLLAIPTLQKNILALKESKYFVQMILIPCD